MNKIRRKALEEIKDKITAIAGELEIVTSEEGDYRDNIPENLQGSERYEKASEAADALGEAVEHLENAAEYIEAAIEV
jgi:hypothetical protein